MFWITLVQQRDKIQGSSRVDFCLVRMLLHMSNAFAAFALIPARVGEGCNHMSHTVFCVVFTGCNLGITPP